jgi:adenosylhomocysteine nucleosidase
MPDLTSKIVVTFALPAESSALMRRLREKNRLLFEGEKITYGKLDNRSVAIFHTGVGRKSCEQRIDKLLRRERPDFLISSGFAGSAREDLQVGDLILAANFSDAELLSKAQQLLAARNPRPIKLVSSTSIIDSAAERNEIARAHGADAVDMETETIAQACATRGLRMLSLRVISDSVREPFPASPRILFDIERQRTDFAKLILHLLRHPAATWHLLRFARQIARAREALTGAIADLVNHF